MSAETPVRRPASAESGLHLAALSAVLLMPWLLLHSRALAELAIDLVAVLFLVRSALRREWRWLRQDWMVLGLLWCGWDFACTLLDVGRQAGLHSGASGTGRLVQSALMVRFVLFLAALQRWVLADPRSRRWFLLSLGAATAYVALQTLLQFATGTNLFGAPRAPDGSLTGPFTKPRAGPTFIRMLFPPLLFAAGWLLARPGLRDRLAAAALVLLAGAVTVLIGQRMPLLLLILGLFSASLFLPQVRRIAAVTVTASLLLVAASAILSPPTFYRLVTKFSFQMEHFSTSHYGEIAGRSLVIAGQHPLTGLGYDGFDVGCRDPGTFHGWTWPQNPHDTGGGIAMCVAHPHNHYLQALVNSGVPGLLIFSGLIVVIMLRLARGLRRHPDPLRVGLFVAALIQEWPIASTSPIISLPIGAWFFLLAGYGLAVAGRVPRASPWSQFENSRLKREKPRGSAPGPR